MKKWVVVMSATERSTTQKRSFFTSKAGKMNMRPFVKSGKENREC